MSTIYNGVDCARGNEAMLNYPKPVVITVDSNSWANYWCQEKVWEDVKRIDEEIYNRAG